jgi:hypothetical protein
MDSQSGISSSGKLYGFVFLFADGADFVAAESERLKAEEAADALSRFAGAFAGFAELDELNATEELKAARVVAALDNPAELSGERDVVVSIIKLICDLFFCDKDSVNEFIGTKCFSDTLSANVIENAQKIAMMNGIFVCMYW